MLSASIVRNLLAQQGRALLCKIASGIFQCLPSKVDHGFGWARGVSGCVCGASCDAGGGVSEDIALLFLSFVLFVTRGRELISSGSGVMRRRLPAPE